MKPLLIAIIALFWLWDLAGWVLGVRTRFLWQLKARLGAGATDLDCLDAYTPWNITGSTCPGPKTAPIC